MYIREPGSPGKMICKVTSYYPLYSIGHQSINIVLRHLDSYFTDFSEYHMAIITKLILQLIGGTWSAFCLI